MGRTMLLSAMYYLLYEEGYCVKVVVEDPNSHLENYGLFAGQRNPKATNGSITLVLATSTRPLLPGEVAIVACCAATWSLAHATKKWPECLPLVTLQIGGEMELEEEMVADGLCLFPHLPQDYWDRLARLPWTPKAQFLGHHAFMDVRPDSLGGAYRRFLSWMLNNRI